MSKACASNMEKQTLVIFATLLLAAAANSAPSSKLGASLQRKLSTSDNVGLDVLVSMQASTGNVLNEVSRMKFGTRAERLNSLAASLQAHAEATQAPISAFLTSKSASFVSFWINNQIFVRGASAELIRELEQFEQVRAINLDERVPVIGHEPPNPADNNVLAEWGVDDIKAPIVWELGSNGTGARVAIVATGVRSTHEALSANYMGSYGWFDPYVGSSTPIDQNGVGTHTAGIAVGSGGIGVAPGATWQACRGCDAATCTQSALVACGQWIACPTLFDGSAPDCSKAPHAVLNGWGTSAGQTFYDDVILAWRAAQVIPIFGVGAGGGCGTVGSPGDSQAGVFAVGSYTEEHVVASASGPSEYGALKPDMVGPGSSIRSAYHTTDNAYTILSSTGNGPAHAIGAIALLYGLQDDLSYSDVYNLLAGTAEPVSSSGQTCGGIPDTIYPNNAAGYGRINVFRAAVGVRN